MSTKPEPAAEAVAARVGELAQPAFAVAVDGSVVTWNRAASVLFGIPSGQATGWPCWLMVGGRSFAGARLCQADCPVLGRGREAPLPMDMVVAPRHGPPRLVRVHHVMLRDDEGQPAVWLHLLDDVQHSRAAERVGQRALALTAALEEGAEVVDLDSLLTRRELEVFLLVAAGQTAREVARTLGIRHATARTHIQRVLGKLGARNRVSALAIALARSAEVSEPQAERPD